jgi:hypothetical protein
MQTFVLLLAISAVSAYDVTDASANHIDAAIERTANGDAEGAIESFR